MKIKLLVAAICTSLINMNSVEASPLWVNVGYSNDGTVWIDQQSIAKDKTFVAFDMKLLTEEKTINASVAAECNTLQFQYLSRATNNVPEAVSSSIKQTTPDSVLATAIYYACATYVRQSF